MTTTARYLLFVLTFILAVPAQAQARIRTVYVEPAEKDNNFQNRVVSAFNARILATERYEIGTPSTVEIEVNVVCLDLSNGNKYVGGGVCSYIFVYWPKELDGLSCSLGPLHTNSNADPVGVAEDIFQDLVSASTEKILGQKLAAMRGAVANARKSE